MALRAYRLARDASLRRTAALMQKHLRDSYKRLHLPSRRRGSRAWYLKRRWHKSLATHITLGNIHKA